MADSGAKATAGASGDTAKPPKKNIVFKKQLKNLKLKDVAKKAEGLDFCAQNPAFVREPEVLPLLMGFLTRYKMPDLLKATLGTLKTLFAVPVTPPLVVVDGDGNAAAGGDIASFVVERSMASESPWKGGDPWINLLTANVAVDIKCEVLDTYMSLLRASLQSNDNAGSAAMAAFALRGNGPVPALLQCIDAGSSGAVPLAHAALQCLELLLRQCIENADVLRDFEAAYGVTRIQRVAELRERRLHVLLLQCLETLSQHTTGRMLLVRAHTPTLLTTMLQGVSETITKVTAALSAIPPPGNTPAAQAAAAQATAQAAIQNALVTAGATSDDGPALCAAIPMICRAFARVHFANSCALVLDDQTEEIMFDESLCNTFLEVALALLQRELSGAPTSVPTTAQTTPATPAAMMLATLFPFSGDRVTCLVTCIGRMVQARNECKTYAKAHGLLPLLVHCLKVPNSPTIRQPTDKLLHLCATNAQDAIDPQLFTAVHAPEDNNATNGQSEQRELPALLSVDVVLALLDASVTTQQKATTYCIVRWLGRVVDSVENARALGEALSMALLAILLDTARDDTRQMAHVTKCVRALIQASSGACEACGDVRNPVPALVAFLQATAPTERNEQVQAVDMTSEDTMENTLAPRYELFLLEWLDDDYAPLTTMYEALDAVAHATDLLVALVDGFNKWNVWPVDTPTPVDFVELLAQKAESASAAAPLSPGTSFKGAAAGASANASVSAKKKGDTVRSPWIAEAPVCAMFENVMALIELIPVFCGHNARVAVQLTRLLATLAQLPTGVKVLLRQAQAQTQRLPPPAATDATDGSDSNIASNNGNGCSTSTPAPVRDFPLPRDRCPQSEHSLLLQPLLYVFESPKSCFEEIDAAVDALVVLTTDRPIPAAAASPPCSTLELVVSESERFVNVGVAAGTVVLLLALTDCVRVPGCPDLSAQDAFRVKVYAAVLQIVTLGQRKQEDARARHRELVDTLTLQQTQQLEQPQAPPSPPPKGSAPPLNSASTLAKIQADLAALQQMVIEYQQPWASELLDYAHSVQRFEYDHYAPLLLACELGVNEVACALLDAGVSTEVANARGVTPLMVALVTGNALLVKRLLSAGACVDAITRDGSDISVWACALSAPMAVDMRALITDAHINKQDDGVPPPATLLELDMIPGQPDLLGECLAAGLDVNTSNADGDFLMHALLSSVRVRLRVRGISVCTRYHSRQLDEDKLYSLVVALVAHHGARVNAFNLLGQSALHLALLFGHGLVATYLLTNAHCRANPNVQDTLGLLPFHYLALGVCGRDRSLEIVQQLLDATPRFECIARVVHVDERKYKTAAEKAALEVEQLLDAGFQALFQPPEISRTLATTTDMLARTSYTENLLPFHIACGGGLNSTLTLEESVADTFQSNGDTRAALLAWFARAGPTPLSTRATKRMTALHFAARSDVQGSNAAVLAVLLGEDNNAPLVDINTVHEPVIIDPAPPVAECADVRLIRRGRPQNLYGFVSHRSLTGVYDVMLRSGELVCGLTRAELLTEARVAPTKYYVPSENAFGALHYALQGSDSAALQILAHPITALRPDGSDLPCLALACTARRCAAVVRQLVTPEANMRVHLPPLGDWQTMAETIKRGGAKHATALHYAVLYEDLPVVEALLQRVDYVNVNVRRSGDGFTPLHLACELRNMPLIKCLLDHGANLVQLSSAAGSMNGATVSAHGGFGAASLLAGGLTPLHLLVKHEDAGLAMLKELIACGYITPELLLRELRTASPPPPVVRSPSNRDNNSKDRDIEGAPLLVPTASSASVLLDVEEENMRLYNEVHEHEQGTGTGTSSYQRRLEHELAKSNDVLELFFELLRPSQALSGRRQSLPPSKPSATSINTSSFHHAHECYANALSRSEWERRRSDIMPHGMLD